MLCIFYTHGITNSASADAWLWLTSFVYISLRMWVTYVTISFSSAVYPPSLTGRYSWSSIRQSRPMLSMWVAKSYHFSKTGSCLCASRAISIREGVNTSFLLCLRMSLAHDDSGECTSVLTPAALHVTGVHINSTNP